MKKLSKSSSNHISRDNKARLVEQLRLEGLPTATVLIGGKMSRGRVQVIWPELPAAADDLPATVTDKLLGSFDLHHTTAAEVAPEILLTAGNGQRGGNIHASRPGW